jgi:PrtD family type I secretion system ABC transporter
MATNSAFGGRVFPVPRGPVLAVGAFSFFSNLLLLAVPLYVFQLFDRVVTSRNTDTLVMLTAITIFALVVQALIDIIRGRVMVRIGLGFERALSRDVLLALMRKSSRGSISSAQSLRDLQEVRSFFTGNALMTLLDAPWIPIYVAVIYLFHPALGLISLSGAAVLLAIAALNSGLTGPAIKRLSETSAASFNEADGYLRNAEAVRAMGMSKRIAARWQRGNVVSIVTFAGATDAAGILSTMAKGFRLFLQMAIMGAGIYLVLEKSATGGVVLAASMLMARALAPVEMAISTWRTISSARAAWDRLTQTLQEAGAESSPMPLPPPKGQVTVERANVLVPGVDSPLLRGIGFRLEPGEILGILGPSGSGKSTLCRVLVGLQPVVPGTVRLDGAELRNWDREQLGDFIGYLPQDVQLLAGSVRENIARMRSDPDAEEVVSAAVRAGAHDVILRLPNGYDTQIGEAGGVLSGGERQRIALARALFGRPKLIVLDEPNAHLDVFGEDALVKSMLDARAEGSTVVIVSHRPSILKRADKLLVLRNGMIEHFGATVEVMQRIRGAVSKPVEIGKESAKPPLPAREQARQPRLRAQTEG